MEIGNTYLCFIEAPLYVDGVACITQTWSFHWWRLHLLLFAILIITL